MLESLEQLKNIKVPSALRVLNPRITLNWIVESNWCLVIVL